MRYSIVYLVVSLTKAHSFKMELENFAILKYKITYNGQANFAEGQTLQDAGEGKLLDFAI